MCTLSWPSIIIYLVQKKLVCKRTVPKEEISFGPGQPSCCEAFLQQLGASTGLCLHRRRSRSTRGGRANTHSTSMYRTCGLHLGPSFCKPNSAIAACHCCFLELQPRPYLGVHGFDAVFGVGGTSYTSIYYIE